jgi:hypothetical protein
VEDKQQAEQVLALPVYEDFTEISNMPAAEDEGFRNGRISHKQIVLHCSHLLLLLSHKTMVRLDCPSSTMTASS